MLNKLSNLFGTKQNNWIEVDYSDWSDNQKEKFNQIKTAVLQKKYSSLIITVPMGREPDERQSLFNYGLKIEHGI